MFLLSRGYNFKQSGGLQKDDVSCSVNVYGEGLWRVRTFHEGCWICGTSGISSGGRTLRIQCVALREEDAAEELEKHLILNSNRVRSFEDARLEIVTYVEAKFGLGIRDSKPSHTAWTLRSHGC